MRLSNDRMRRSRRSVTVTLVVVASIALAVSTVQLVTSTKQPPARAEVLRAGARSGGLASPQAAMCGARRLTGPEAAPAGTDSSRE